MLFLHSNVKITYIYIYKKGVTVAPEGDFLFEDTYLFEVGGRGKNYSQIADIENSFLAVADTEVGIGSRIPLWMFGLMY